ncbi:hypothetical protein COOONC_12696 [Cooperia oncophora]
MRDSHGISVITILVASLNQALQSTTEASNEMLVYLSTVGLDTIKQIPIQFRFGKHHVAAACYPMLYSAVHIIDLPKDSVSTWILCFFTQDLAIYLGHRAVHEAGVLWSVHEIHHTSEYYNLSTALRLSINQVF